MSKGGLHRHLADTTSHSLTMLVGRQRPSLAKILVSIWLGLLVDTVAFAQIPGLPYGSDVEVDPKRQQQHDLQRQLSMPNTPVLLSPADNLALQLPTNTSAAPTFQWKSGGGTATRYILCIFEAAKNCSAPGSAVYSIPGTIQEFTPVPGLSPEKFQGKSLKWTVAACKNIIARQPPSSEQCRISKPRMIRWTLPPPAQIVASPITLSNEPAYQFGWTPVFGADAGYLLCLTFGNVSQCPKYEGPLYIMPFTKGTTSIAIILRMNELPLSQLRGQSIRWTVATCQWTTRPNFDCVYHPTGGSVTIPR